MNSRTVSGLMIWMAALPAVVLAEPPSSAYVFPAGGQRGTKVNVRVAGCDLQGGPRLIWSGKGVSAPERPVPMETIWFEGPVIPQPASQQKEDYPKDHAALMDLAADAPLGMQTWRFATSQGITAPRGFIVGDLPEVVEAEVEGTDSASKVSLPVTINGRIFPREDVDAWSFFARKGETVTCDVATSQFGSPLDARLEVRDGAGQILAEQLPVGSTTPRLRFTAPEDGEYQVRIHDMSFGGLQDHVYRLTLTTGPCLDGVYPLGGRRGTKASIELSGIQLKQPVAEITLPAEGFSFVWQLNPAASGDKPLDTKEIAWGQVAFDLDDLEEHREVEPNDSDPKAVSLPSVLNGRIQSPGDSDLWSFVAKKGTEYDFEARAARLGSPLDAVLELFDEKGNRIAEADDTQGLLTDGRLRWTAPAEGTYKLSVKDRLATRGGTAFAYRIRATSTEQPDFNITVQTDTAIVERGKSINIKVQVDRGPGFKEPITLEIEGLPAGVTLEKPVTVGAGQKDVQIQLKADAMAPVTAGPLKVVGKAKVGDTELVRTGKAVSAPVPGNKSGPAVTDGSLSLAVALPTPFKFVGLFETKFVSRGAVFVRHYKIERNGFDGPLEVRLADKQGRHLQGVTASSVTVPAGQSEFDFAVTLPSWMEIGRTCRSTLSVSGQVTDPDGTTHTVSYSSNDQNNQMIALVDPGRLAVQPGRTTVVATRGKTLEVPIRLQRDRGLNQPATVDLVIPKGVTGLSAPRIEIAGDQSSGTLVIQVGDNPAGLELRPLTLRALTRDERGLPLTGEASLTFVPENK